MCCRVYRNAFWDLKDEHYVKTPSIDVEHEYEHVFYSSQFCIKFLTPCSVPIILLWHREMLGCTLHWCRNEGKKVLYCSVQHLASRRCRELRREPLGLMQPNLGYLAWTGDGKKRMGCHASWLCLGRSFPSWPKPLSYPQAEMAENVLIPHCFSSLYLLSTFRNPSGNWKSRTHTTLKTSDERDLPQQLSHPFALFLGMLHYSYHQQNHGFFHWYESHPLCSVSLDSHIPTAGCNNELHAGKQWRWARKCIPL